MVIKPAREGSSYGISVAENYSDFFDGLQMALRYDKKWWLKNLSKGLKLVMPS